MGLVTGVLGLGLDDMALVLEKKGLVDSNGFDIVGRNSFGGTYFELFSFKSYKQYPW